MGEGLKMTGEEIAQTFGDREVLNLEQQRDGILQQIDQLREALSESWSNIDTMDDVERIEGEIEQLEETLRNVRTLLRKKRAKFSSIVDGAEPLAPMSEDD